MNKLISLYKRLGETPLQTLVRLRGWGGVEYKDIKMTYIGRLDPMAEGVMLVLVGEECKNREKYLGLDKTYITEILFGVSTDTGDVLGKVVESRQSMVSREEIVEKLKKFLGRQSQKYPAYSSKVFSGSYKDIQNGKRAEIFHDVEVYYARLLDIHEINNMDMLDTVKKRITLVNGDFRQGEILKNWEDILNNDGNIEYNFVIAKIELSVSSGFYVRQFAEDFGMAVGVSALAFSIVREKVGEYSVVDCLTV